MTLSPTSPSRLTAVVLASIVVACTSDGPSEREATEAEALPPGIAMHDDVVTFTTEEFTLGAGEERFLCYAANTPEDLAIAGYEHAGSPVLHHVIFSQTSAPEPDGLSECDTLFRMTWEPLYLAGAGSSHIDFPEGTGHRFAAGSQLVTQLHLLNASAEAVTESVTLHMKRAASPDPRPIGSYVLGSLGVNLPPLQQSSISGECAVQEDVQLIAAFPHMHLLGQSLTVEAGPSPEALEVVFERDPYNFDNQTLEPFDLTLSAGDHARVTCSYDNTLDHAVTFGESTTNEMCFFIGFAPDRSGISACLFSGEPVGDPVPIDPEAGVCGEHTPTADGIGAPCTAGGNECTGDMSCTADYREDEPDGVCFRLGCESDADCGGEGMTCCAPASGGGAFNLCIPEACRQTTCIPR